LVGDCRRVHAVFHRLRTVEQASLLCKRAIAAEAVDRTVAGGGHEPRARIGRRPLSGPALRRDRECFLGGLLGEVEIAEEANQARENPAPFVAEDLLDGAYQYTSLGRISIAPPSRAAGIREASSIAASRSSASRTK